MSLLAHKAYLRAMTPVQRRAWVHARMTLTPKVKISSQWLPLSIQSQYAYVNTLPYRSRSDITSGRVSRFINRLFS